MHQSETIDFVDRLLRSMVCINIIDNYIVENIDADHFQAVVIRDNKRVIITLYDHLAISGDIHNSETCTVCNNEERYE